MRDKLSDYDYNLPPELIAINPAKPRDHSRLLVFDAKKKSTEDHTFYELYDLLKAGDVLVINESKVFPARLFGKRKGTGGKIEILLSRPVSNDSWEVVGKNLKVETELIFKNTDLIARVISKKDEFYILEFNKKDADLFKIFEKIGAIPLPPYIKKEASEEDRINYQTVYANKVGSVAAPTAGLHFTESLLRKIKQKGVTILKITLHVGLGTFSPVTGEDYTKHKIHKEYYEVGAKTIEKLYRAKEMKQRIIAVGTTTTRVLEHLFQNEHYEIKDGATGWTEIFIYPGYRFRCVDGLITNFHIPRSSLLLLVSAFVGKKNIDSIYREAINKKYRFYSYGDAMLLLK